MTRQALLLDMYRTMLDALGPSGWWPGETPFEVAVGAILTQNTSWSNVEKAITILKTADLLQGERLLALPSEELAELIRPVGYYRLKADRLKNLLAFLDRECGFDMEVLAAQGLDELRPKLLAVKGVGPETADSILLYAMGLPSFVSDTYTRRILSRHGLTPEDAGYEEIRELFMDVLPLDPALFNEFHALLVRTGNTWCRKKSGLCSGCPLSAFLG